MCCRPHCVRLALAITLASVVTKTSSAAEARFHYVPANGSSAMSLAPGACAPAAGERLSFFGAVRDPICAPPRPTHFLSFVHPATGCIVTVPVCLPEGTPTIEYQTRRVTYNYGSYFARVLFLPDGSVDVVYNSGLLRGL